LVGLSLVLVVEGLIPFASPGRYRRLVEVISNIQDSRLRAAGGACMFAGLLLLYAVH